MLSLGRSLAPLISNMTIPRTSFSGLKLYSPPRAFLDLPGLRFFSFTSCVVTDFDEVGVDAEESVTSAESNEFVRDDRSRFPGKNFANPPPDFWEGGVFPTPPRSVADGVGARLSEGVRRSSSSSSSSSEEGPSSWKSGAPGIERTVPIPSVCVQI